MIASKLHFNIELHIILFSTVRVSTFHELSSIAYFSRHIVFYFLNFKLHIVHMHTLSTMDRAS